MGRAVWERIKKITQKGFRVKLIKAERQFSVRVIFLIMIRLLVQLHLRFYHVVHSSGQTFGLVRVF